MTNTHSIRKKFLSFASSAPAVRASFFFALGGVIQKGISVVCVPIFTRILSTEEYGLFNLYCSWISVFSIIATLNMTGSLLFCGMQRFRERRDEFLSSLSALIYSGILISLVIYLIFSPYIDSLTGLNRPLTLLMFLEIAGSSGIAVYSMRERFDYKYKTALLITLALSLLTPALGICVILITGSGAAGRIAMGAILAFLTGGILTALTIIRGKRIFSRDMWKYSLLFAIPLIPHYLAQSALHTADRILIDRILDRDSVALYSVAYSVGMLSSVICSAINSSLHPWCIKAAERGDFRQIRRMVALSLALVGAVSLSVSFFAPEAISLLAPPSYVDSRYAVAPLSASVFFIFMTQFFSNAEFTSNKTFFSTFSSLAGGALNILLNLLLLPIYGFVAAAYTTLAAYIFTSVLHFFYIRFSLRKNVFPSRVCLGISVIFLSLSSLSVVMCDFPFARYGIGAAMLILFFRLRKKFWGAYREI